MKKKRRPSRTPAPESPVAAPIATEPTAWYVYVLRAMLVAALSATLWLTWPLWSDRVDPPLLPLIVWPKFTHFGTLMIATAATFIVWPRAGLAAHVLTTLAAMTADQTRMQPQIFSIWLLMLGTLPSPTARFVGRCHLASLWFFSGFHKLLSAEYYRSVSKFLWFGMFPDELRQSLPDFAVPTAAALAVVELTLGLAVFLPRLRRAAAVVIVVLHLGVIWILHRHNNWNTSVWPWNVALATVGATLIVTWRRSLIDEFYACGRAGFGAGAALFFSPLLFYVGLLDPYLSHCLYSANVANATLVPSGPRAVPYSMNAWEGPYWRNLNVPQPPCHRIFDRYFRAVAKPGDVLEVVDSRLCAKWGGYAHYTLYHRGDAIVRIVVPDPP